MELYHSEIKLTSCPSDGWVGTETTLRLMGHMMCPNCKKSGHYHFNIRKLIKQHGANFICREKSCGFDWDLRLSDEAIERYKKIIKLYAQSIKLARAAIRLTNKEKEKSTVRQKKPMLSFGL